MLLLLDWGPWGLSPDLLAHILATDLPTHLLGMGVQSDILLKIVCSKHTSITHFGASNAQVALAPLTRNPQEIPFRDSTSPWGADLQIFIQIKHLVKFK